MKTTVRLGALVAGTSLLCALGCNGGDDSAASDGNGTAGSIRDAGSAGSGAPAVETMPVEIEFALVAGAQAVDCSSQLEHLGTADTGSTLSDAHMFVQDLRLFDKDGSAQPVTLDADGSFQAKNVGLLDFEDGTGDCAMNGTPETHESLTGTVAKGDYSGIAFSIGVPEDENHGDPTTADPPLDQMDMHWDWNSGYRFFRFELVPSAGIPFDVHIGSTECTKDKAGKVTCKKSNRADVMLSDFDPQNDAVAVDVGIMVSGSDLDNDFPGCIAGGTDDLCVPIYAQLGIDASSGNGDAGTQKVFQVVAR